MILGMTFVKKKNRKEKYKKEILHEFFLLLLLKFDSDYESFVAHATL